MKEHQKIPEKHWIYRMDNSLKFMVQKKGEYIEGFGFSHGPSSTVWKSTLDKSYIIRMNKALNIFDIPKYENLSECRDFVVADIGCGPWGGIFFVRRWPVMYLVDPSWSVYEKEGVVKILSRKCCWFIEDYAQTFNLPQKANLIFSINTLNHGGDIKKSIDNIMNNLKPTGLFFLHLHLREEKDADSGHPMAITQEVISKIISKYNIVQCDFLDNDPMRGLNGRKTVVATLRNKI